MLTAHFRVLGNAITTIFGDKHKNVQPLQITPSWSTLKNLNSTKLPRTCCEGTDSSLLHAYSIFFWEPESTWEKVIRSNCAAARTQGFGTITDVTPTPRAGTHNAFTSHLEGCAKPVITHCSVLHPCDNLFPKSQNIFPKQNYLNKTTENSTVVSKARMVFFCPPFQLTHSLHPNKVYIEGIYRNIYLGFELNVKYLQQNPLKK